MQSSAVQAWGWALALCVLSGCAGVGGGLRTAVGVQDRAPGFIPDHLADLPDPVPIEEPLSSYGNPPSYEVFGVTYTTLESAAGYVAEGLASWYGAKFHGRPTSSREPYNMYALTAAHRSLPIPSFLQVTNLENGRRTLVRVNDRGPFHPGRILDLSFAAAVKLGFVEQGTARVRIEALDLGPGIYLQAGAFRQLRGARALRRNLEVLTGESTKVVGSSKDELYRVRIGPVASEARARQLQSIVAAADYGVPIVLRFGDGLRGDWELAEKVP